MTAHASTEPGERVPARTTRPKRRRIFIALGAMAVLLVAVVVWRSRSQSSRSGAPAAASAEARVVPVSVATVGKQDVPVYLEGLGNAQPLATVTIKSQVDGRLDKVVFQEGQEVKKGDLLAQVDPRPFAIQLHQAEAALMRDGAQFRNAKLNLERFRELRLRNLIAQQQVDDQQAMVDQLEGGVKADEATAENARLQLDYARIKSPIDGTTGVRLVDPGNVVHASDPTGIVVVTQIDPMAVVFTLPQDDLPRVSKKLAEGPLTVEAYNRDGAIHLQTGRLELIDNQVNQATATIRLKAIFPNANRSLWPSEFVKVKLLLTTEKDALTIPAAAVQRGPQGVFVYVVGPDQTVGMRPIETGTTVDQLAIVSKGLSPGDRVVVEGQNQLRPGAKVAPRPAGSSGPPGSRAPSPAQSGAPAPSAGPSQ
jgi:multidrug efflux system membrane fusion protein